MNDAEIDSLLGQTAALSMVIGALIRAMPALTAAQTGAELAIALEDSRAHDEEDGSSQRLVATRDGLAEAYLGLLSAVAKSG